MILCVTGNRALGDHPEAALWARRRLAEAMATEGCTVVVHGGARGPDTWAHDLAGVIGLRRVVFGGDGVVRDDLHGERPWCRPDDKPAPTATRAEWAPWYLHRDRVMVRWVARHAEAAGGARVLCLRAPWSRTNGAGYTADRARALGLDVTDLTFGGEQ